MKIHFERTGGFAGMLMSNTIDTKSLPANEANDIQNLIDVCKFFELPSNLFQRSPSKSIKGAADYFTYKITIENGNRKHSVECTDLNMQPAVKRLVDFLVKLTRK
jgi:hypothetical protein